MWVSTSEGIILVRPALDDPERSIVSSTRLATLESLITSLELAGVAEDDDIEELYIRKKKGSDTEWYINMSRVSLNLWFSFEVLNYLDDPEENGVIERVE